MVAPTSNATAAVAKVTDQTAAPWLLLIPPFVGLAYIILNACLELLCCKCPAFFRDLRELLKAMATIGIMMLSTLVLLFCVSAMKSSETDLSIMIRQFEYTLVIAIAGLTLFGTIRTLQTTHPDKDMLDAEEGWRPQSVYQDLSDRSMVKSLISFFGQNILLVYLMGGVFSGFNKLNTFFHTGFFVVLNKAEQQMTPSKFGESLLFLITSAFVQTLVWDQMGASFEQNIPQWKTLWYHFRGETVQVFDVTVAKGSRQRGCWCLRCFDEVVDDSEGPPASTKVASGGSFEKALTMVELGDWITLRSQVSARELIVRMLFSWYVNGVIRKLVVVLVPLMLITVDSYLDFVQNATALTFIVQLDDLMDSKRIRVKKSTAQTGDLDAPLVANQF